MPINVTQSPYLPLLQTKETLTTRVSSFGSKCELPAPLLKKIGDCGIMDSILSFAEFKSQKELKKGDGAKRARLTGAGLGYGSPLLLDVFLHDSMHEARLCMPS